MIAHNRLGIFPGSFDPFHKGHLDIVWQALKQFDKVIIAVGKNPSKEKSNINRVETIKLQMAYFMSKPDIEVEEFSGFIVDYVQDKESLDEYTSVSLIRGLRNASDLEYEKTQARILQDQYPNVKSVFFLASKGLEHISSSVIRALEKIQEGSASEYIVKHVKFMSPGIPLIEKD